jgi:hypothetical protein
VAKAFEELKERPLYVVRESSRPYLQRASTPEIRILSSNC